MTKTRTARDSMGEVRVPADAYYGAQTQRAVDNFPVSGLQMPRSFLRAMGLIKKAAAETNCEMKLLDEKLKNAVTQSAQEVIDGKLDDQFPVDVFQTGSGTSSNMNTNEVIAGRANEILGGERGSRSPVHPNDHVNKSQSSNDVIPSAIHIAAMESIEQGLLPALRELKRALEAKAGEFDDVVKIGRTHLADATPVRLGQEFGGYASMVDHGIRRVEISRAHLSELALGGTAVGTGINMPAGFAKGVIERVSRETGIPFREAENHFEAQGAQDSLVETSGALKTVAVSLMKIANDIRWLSSGPRCGIQEISIPSLQPGSSIMPGKVNPVIPESVMQVCAQVIGHDAAITVGGQHGNFELIVMMPMMAHNLLSAIRLLGNVSKAFAEKCVSGIQSNRERCSELIEKSLAMCTALAPHIGYDKAAAIAKEAFESGRTVREIALEKKVMDSKKLDDVLNPRRMTEPGV